MSRRQWLLSAFFVLVAMLKVAEGLFRLENWPLSDVRMFSQRVPAARTLWRVTLWGSRDGAWFELQPADFHVSEDEFRRQLAVAPGVLPARCAQLGRLYNADPRFVATPLRAMQVRISKVERPGVPFVPFDQTLPCPLGASR